MPSLPGGGGSAKKEGLHPLTHQLTQQHTPQATAPPSGRGTCAGPPPEVRQQAQQVVHPRAQVVLVAGARPAVLHEHPVDVKQQQHAAVQALPTLGGELEAGQLQSARGVGVGGGAGGGARGEEDSRRWRRGCDRGPQAGHTLRVLLVNTIAWQQSAGCRAPELEQEARQAHLEGLGARQRRRRRAMHVVLRASAARRLDHHIDQLHAVVLAAACRAFLPAVCCGGKFLVRCARVQVGIRHGRLCAAALLPPLQPVLV